MAMARIALGDSTNAFCGQPLPYQPCDAGGSRCGTGFGLAHPTVGRIKGPVLIVEGGNTVDRVDDVVMRAGRMIN
jgi:hypothetical protein